MSSLPLPRGLVGLALISVASMIMGGVVVFAGQAIDRQHCNAQFFLLNARRRCTGDEPPKKQEYDQLVENLKDKIDGWKQQGKISFASVYFRDLENGPTFSLNVQEYFAPASLLKVPVMIALLKEAEDDPSILNLKLGLPNGTPDEQNVFDKDQTLAPGQKYPVSEILRRMIVYSDNSSKEVLVSYLETRSPGILDQTFIDLGISLQDINGSKSLTIKSYASLFRALYNASFLSREMSQRALDLLSKVEFSPAIVAGVSPGTVVAHKFGFLKTTDGIVQLHDCGIVFSPKMPYLLCIMTRGKNEQTIEPVMAEISKDIFDEVLRRNE